MFFQETFIIRDDVQVGAFGYRAVATAMTRVSAEISAKIPDTMSVLLFVARWLMEETASHIRWETQREVFRLIDAAADTIVDEDQRRERVKEERRVGRARRRQECKGGSEEATSEGPAARAGPPCKGRKGGGALDSNSSLQDEAPEGEGGAGAPEGS